MMKYFKYIWLIAAIFSSCAAHDKAELAEENARLAYGEIDAIKYKLGLDPYD